MPVVPYHLAMLADRYRVSCYARALARVVRKGDRVVDLGAGTGLLGFLALRYGAGRLDCVERGPIVHVARRLAHDAGVADRVTFHHGRACDVRLKGRADLLITDLLGSLGVDDGIVGLVWDARRRWLRPGARILPSRVDLMACPVAAPGLAREIRSGTRPAGFDFATLRELAAHGLFGRPRRVGRPLASPGRALRVDLERAALSRVDPARLAGRSLHRVLRPGRIDALDFWFEARLAPGIVLDSRQARAWGRTLTLVAPALAVARGDRLMLEIEITGGREVSWRLELRRAGRRITSLSRSTILCQPDVLAPEGLAPPADR